MTINRTRKTFLKSDGIIVDPRLTAENLYEELIRIIECNDRKNLLEIEYNKIIGISTPRETVEILEQENENYVVFESIICLEDGKFRTNIPDRLMDGKIHTICAKQKSNNFLFEDEKTFLIDPRIYTSSLRDFLEEKYQAKIVGRFISIIKNTKITSNIENIQINIHDSIGTLPPENASQIQINGQSVFKMPDIVYDGQTKIVDVINISNNSRIEQIVFIGDKRLQENPSLSNSNVLQDLFIDEDEVNLIQSNFDYDYYELQLTNQSIHVSRRDYVQHYISEGEWKGLRPHKSFDATKYAEVNPDIIGHNGSFYAHYLKFGIKESRPLDRLSLNLAHEKSIAQPEFDKHFYLATYPEVELSGIDPLEHFLTKGWKEGKDPSFNFCTNAYIELHPDVKESGDNPLIHYIRTGRAEGRVELRSLGYKHHIIRSLLPVKSRNSTSSPIENRQLDGKDKLKEFVHIIGSRPIYITVGQRHYKDVGGIEICIQREAVNVESNDIVHIHLYPSRQYPLVGYQFSDCALNVVVSDQSIGQFLSSEIAQAFVELSRNSKIVTIHSLLGHNVSNINTILKALDVERAYFWLHDYASICAGYHLLRNDVEYCGAPAPESTACSICVYGPYRKKQIQQHDLLFDNFVIDVLSPSEIALTLWKKATNYRYASSIVHAHAALVEFDNQKNSRNLAGVQTIHDRTITVAFIGSPTTHKGWPVFAELAVKYQHDVRYRFIHFGKERVKGLPIIWRFAQVDEKSQAEFVKTLISEKIDLCILWSLWPETFCFAAYEAAASGAAILTNVDSGAVRDLIEKYPSLGRILHSVDQLFNLFDTGDVEKLLRYNNERKENSITFSKCTYNLIEKIGTGG